MKHNGKVLSLLNIANASFKPIIYNFFANTIDEIGHIERLTRLEPACYTTGAIHKPKPSTYITEWRSYFGLGNAFRQLIPSVVRYVSPLYQHWKRYQRRTFPLFNSKVVNAMKTLKAALIMLPELALPYSRGRLRLDADVCNVQSGSGFLQRKPD